jgi:uncharacterized membrane protein YdbT with pleckstrin-like domain
MGNKKGVVIAKTWRSELSGMVLFFVLCIASILLSRIFPLSVLRGELLPLGDYRLILHLPLFWLVPAFTLAAVFFRIYNVRYWVDAHGIEARVGILSLQQRITKVRYQDIRSVETEQSVIDRALDIGDVCVGTAATGSLEIVFNGISAPTEVQDMIQRERDRRQKFKSNLQSKGQDRANA